MNNINSTIEIIANILNNNNIFAYIDRKSKILYLLLCIN